MLVFYQWYSNTTNSTGGGTAAGTNSNTYTPSTATIGTMYYYVVVTNTNNDATGETTAVATSVTAAVTVSPQPTSADALFAIDLKIYPNPFADEVRITGVSSSTLRVVNSAGATVHIQIIESDDETVRLGQPAGAYLFVFEKEGKSKTVVVIKE